MRARNAHVSRATGADRGLVWKRTKRSVTQRPKASLQVSETIESSLVCTPIDRVDQPGVWRDAPRVDGSDLAQRFTGRDLDRGFYGHDFWYLVGCLLVRLSPCSFRSYFTG